jgi:glutamate transport system permease protein
MSNILYEELGPRAKRATTLWAMAGGVAIAGILGWALFTLWQRNQLSAQVWGVLLNPDLGKLLASGLVETLRAAVVAMLLSLLAGTLVAAGRLSENLWVRVPVRVATEILRGLPLLLLIFFLYLGAPALGIDVSIFWALVLGMTLYNCAVIGEIVRAGILSLPKGQAEAARAIGLTPPQTLRYVLIPQAVRRMLPALVSQLVIMLKETSLGFIIGYHEMLRNGRTAVEYLGGQYSIAVYTLIAIIYVAMNTSLSVLTRRLDERGTRHDGSVRVAPSSEAV